MTSNDLRQLDNRHVWHPFTPMLEHCREQTPIICAADGFYLIDGDGRRYLDGVSSLWCNVHGHRVASIDAAIRAQLERVAHSTLLGLSHVPSIELAAELARRAPPGLGRVFFSDNGSTAVEAALKIAWQFHRQKREAGRQREIFVRLSGAYHGDTIGSVSVGGIEQFHRIYGGLLFRTLEVPSPVALRTPPGHTAETYLAWCHVELERTIEARHEQIAGVVIEPIVQGAAGILVHPHGYLRLARELTARHGIPLIADEVATGLGRTGRFWACDHEQVAPDILCVAKGLTGGYLPLAATLVTEEIYSPFLAEPAEGKTFFHGHTYTGNPLACAAALASLELFDRCDLLGNIKATTGILSRRLAELADHPFVAEVRQKGVMVGIELVRNRQTLEPFPAERRVGHRVVLAARNRGVIIRPLGDVIVLMPAPAMPGELVDQLCTAVFEAIDETLRSG